MVGRDIKFWLCFNAGDWVVTIMTSATLKLTKLYGNVFIGNTGTVTGKVKVDPVL
jgi:hypothetical protein